MNCAQCSIAIKVTKRPNITGLCRTCYQKRYRQQNKEKIIRLNSRWYEANKAKDIADSVAYQLNRLKVDTNYKLVRRLRLRLNQALNGNFKNGSAVRALGCSIEQFRVYLESKFQPGMTWNNWSITGWHIDHVVPISSFDLSDPHQIDKACHFSNLQPLWAKDNLRKGAKHGQP